MEVFIAGPPPEQFHLIDMQPFTSCCQCPVNACSADVQNSSYLARSYTFGVKLFHSLGIDARGTAIVGSLQLRSLDTPALPRSDEVLLDGT
jgi:hypothetical protein